MRKVFKSKVDWWLIAIILIVFAYPIVDGMMTKQYGLSITMLVVLGLIAFMFSKIKYEIDEKILKMKFIPFEKFIKLEIH